MQRMRNRNKKLFAAIFLLIFSIETFYPGVALALTSGPAQPEMQKFTPAGVGDMVDLFTGDFKENITLMDVGGYPLNLSYHSGFNMEEEASWVGAGWTLNPGSVTRQLRGLPDDFDGIGDGIQKVFYKKDFKKAGGSVLVKPTFWGFDNLINPPSFKLDVYKDNYFGIGASFGASVSFNVAGSKDTKLTAGLDFSSDSRDGVNVRPSFDMTTSQEDDGNDVSSTTLSGSLLYNTRAGLKSYSLDASFGANSGNTGESPDTRGDVGSSTIGSFTHYFGQTYTPSFSVNTKSSSYTLSVDVGPYAFGGYLGLGGSGYVYNEHVTDTRKTVPAYGYLNYLHGRSNDNALLDFNREKDGLYVPSAPSIGIPISTQDMFTVTGQSGTGQYRAFTAGNYIVNDPKYSNVSDNAGGKLTVGGGWIWQLGGRLDYTHGDAVSKKWSDNNNYLNVGQFAADASNPLDEPAYFKRVGELTAADGTWMGKIDNANTDEVKLNGMSTLTSFKSRASSNIPLSAPFRRTVRDRRVNTFSVMTAYEAQAYGFDPSIIGRSGTVVGDYNLGQQAFGRVGDYRRSNHISEVTVTDNEGKRNIYGIPVYNATQQEFSFAVNPANIGDKAKARRTGLIPYTSADINTVNPTGKNSNGRDGLVQKETIPAYPTSFLLTNILSPDYVDRTNNGISDDDFGTAYKFNYIRTGANYKWRAPFLANTANFNENLQSDPKDDRGNIVYGEKELWYLRSVESKTMIAIFSVSPREDGLGVLNTDGGANTGTRVLKLDSISLFSKADWARNGTGAIPVKVAHFEYDYSLFPGVPNNTGTQIADPYNSPAGPSPNVQKGKLTLKRLYFTFGINSRGRTNPYIFEYDLRAVNPGITGLPLPNIANDPGQAEANDLYADRQGDRWGTYKQSWYNNPVPGSGVYLNNAEYPYALQKNSPPTGVSATDWSDMLDRMSGKWELNKITTPFGSIINVMYEAKDYAYVQDKEAMQMYFIKGFEDVGQNPSNVINAQYVDVVLPVALTGGVNEFVTKYLDGTNTLYYKVNTNMKGDLNATDIANKTFNEYVNGYAGIDPSKCIVSPDNKTVKIWINKIGNYSPIARQVWQKIKTDVPQYAYNGYDNSDLNGSDIAIIGQAIYWTLVNFRELWSSFDNIASKAGMGAQVDFTRSLVRLKSPTVSRTFSDGARTFSKTGGGCRVRKIEIADQWALMVGAGAKTATYGQEYKYTTTGKYGTEISSGVASYEPQGGSEENPFHQAIPYTEKVHWGIDRYHFIEKPYCESYFPGPVIGYGKVTVTSYGDNNARETGYIVNEFYTAKDFPTLVDNLPLDNPSSQFILPLLFFTTATYNQATSQGFRIELNDMHGKPKAVHVFDKAGRELSSSEYFYRVLDQGAEQKQLNNDGVPILNRDGTVGSATLGTDIDLVTDARTSKNENIGGSVGIYPGGFVIPLLFAPLYIPTFGVVPYVNYMNKSYYSTSTVKVISRYGMLSSVRTVKNGSSITAYNTLWDGETGDVLVKKTQNEFNDYTYSFHYPAYMVNEGMGAAYKNLGAVWTNLTTNSVGQITNPSSPSQYLFPGDELLSTYFANVKAWVMVSSDGSYRLIDQAGNFITNASGAWFLLRSGRRNMLNSEAGSVMTMSDPVQGGRLSLDVSRRILDAKSVVYNEKWAMPQYCLASADTIHNAPTGSVTCYAVCEGDQNSAYNQCGTQIFAPGFNSANGTGSVIYSMSGAFWGGNCGGGAALVAPKSGAVVAGAPVSQAKKTSDSLAAFSVVPGSKTQAIINPNVSIPSGCAQSPGGRILTNNYPLSRTSIWTCMGSTGGRQPTGTPVRFATCINAPTTKTYYVGISADNEAAFYLDGQLVVHLVNSGGTVFNYWEVYPVNITAGKHTIIMEGTNASGAAALGCEIYNNTAQEINTATSYSNLNVLFTTRDVIGQNLGIGNMACSSGYLDVCGAMITCTSVTPHPPTLNPYYAGMLGNWHSDTSYVYSVNRAQQVGLTGQNGGTDIRNSGYYNSFTPFYDFQPSGPLVNRAYEDNRWIWSSAAVFFDPKGNEVENTDALGRYGSALFGYSQSLPTAVAMNARHNEIAYDGFEDYYFALAGTAVGCQPSRHLDWGFTNQAGTWTSSAGTISNTMSHTGNWSYKLTGTASISKSLGSATPITSFLGYDGTGRYLLTGNEQAVGFAPVNNKKYILSLWVNEDNGGNPTSNKVQKLDVKINGVSLNPSVVAVPVVEGWKRLELAFTVSGSFQLDLVPSGTVYIDDFRLLPFDGEMTSYVYDDTKLKLTAKLDENNFAYIYEYDDEGTPIRVKKETEKGIVTIRENRQSFIAH